MGKQQECGADVRKLVASATLTMAVLEGHLASAPGRARGPPVAAIPSRSLVAVHPLPSGQHATTTSALAMSMPTKIAVDVIGPSTSRRSSWPGLADTGSRPHATVRAHERDADDAHAIVRPAHRRKRRAVVRSRTSVSTSPSAKAIGKMVTVTSKGVEVLVHRQSFQVSSKSPSTLTCSDSSPRCFASVSNRPPPRDSPPPPRSHHRGRDPRSRKPSIFCRLSTQDIKARYARFTQIQPNRASPASRIASSPLKSVCLTPAFADTTPIWTHLTLVPLVQARCRGGGSLPAHHLPPISSREESQSDLHPRPS